MHTDDSSVMYCMLYVTAKTEDEAAKLANHLLEKRLIACANIFKIRSLYRWQSKVQDEAEFAIIMKTRKFCVPQAIDEAAKIHSYEVPCVVTYDIKEGLPSYLAWIDKETRTGFQ